MMTTKLGFCTRILMVFHIKSTNQGLCNGIDFVNFSFEIRNPMEKSLLTLMSLIFFHPTQYLLGKQAAVDL